MQHGKTSVTDAIKRLIVLFATKSSDRRTLDELHRLIGDRNGWHGAHDLFNRIRQKNGEANRQGDIRLESQFGFEEACAKTLYNLGRYPAAFDPDSSYWIVPNALIAARHWGIDEGEIISAVVS